MGVLNVTPDSFSDGGLHFGLDDALGRAQEMIAQGATIIDIGGESTRPGAEPVSLDEERRRVVPLIRRLSATCPVPVSVDTSKPELMNEAVDAGATLINDVCALTRPGALAAASQTGANVCLMHMQGEPRTMQRDPDYDDVVAEVRDYLCRRVDACLAAGIAEKRILVDPGFGFGKSLEHNMALMQGLDRIVGIGFPVLVGVSRKSMFGALLGRAAGERLAGSVSMAAIAVMMGASVVRAHDVPESVDAARIGFALRGGD